MLPDLSLKKKADETDIRGPEDYPIPGEGLQLPLCTSLARGPNARQLFGGTPDRTDPRTGSTKKCEIFRQCIVSGANDQGAEIVDLTGPDSGILTRHGSREICISRRR